MALLGACAAASPRRHTGPPGHEGRFHHPRRTIIVNKANNTLKLYGAGRRVWMFRVATGKWRSTPEGTFRIVQKARLPVTAASPFGPRWMALNTLGKRKRHRIGIHGTNCPDSIGRYASKGCVRMRNTDIKRVFAMAPVGTVVRIGTFAYRHPPAGPKRLASRLVPKRLASRRHSSSAG